jgi:hypothetical protein
MFWLTVALIYTFIQQCLLTRNQTLEISVYGTAFAKRADTRVQMNLQFDFAVAVNELGNRRKA